jgi:hypothetical protein
VGGRRAAGQTNVREASASQATSGTQQQGSLYTVEEDALHASKLSESTTDRAADISRKEARDRTDSGFPVGVPVGAPMGPVATSSGTSYGGNKGAGVTPTKGGAASRQLHTSARAATTRVWIGGGDWVAPVEADHAPRASQGESGALSHGGVRASLSGDAGSQCRWHDTAELWQASPSAFDDIRTDAATSNDLREGIPAAESVADRTQHAAVREKSVAGATGAARPTQYSTVAVEFIPAAGPRSGRASG